MRERRKNPRLIRGFAILATRALVSHPEILMSRFQLVWLGLFWFIRKTLSGSAPVSMGRMARQLFVFGVPTFFAAFWLLATSPSISTAPGSWRERLVASTLVQAQVRGGFFLRENPRATLTFCSDSDLPPPVLFVVGIDGCAGPDLGPADQFFSDAAALYFGRGAPPSPAASTDRARALEALAVSSGSISLRLFFAAIGAFSGLLALYWLSLAPFFLRLLSALLRAERPLPKFPALFLNDSFFEFLAVMAAGIAAVSAIGGALLAASFLGEAPAAAYVYGAEFMGAPTSDARLLQPDQALALGCVRGLRDRFSYRELVGAGCMAAVGPDTVDRGSRSVPLGSWSPRELLHGDLPALLSQKAPALSGADRRDALVALRAKRDQLLDAWPTAFAPFLFLLAAGGFVLAMLVAAGRVGWSSLSARARVAGDFLAELGQQEALAQKEKAALLRAVSGARNASDAGVEPKKPPRI
jgi:hypothetical protein